MNKNKKSECCTISFSTKDGRRINYEIPEGKLPVDPEEVMKLMDKLLAKETLNDLLEYLRREKEKRDRE